MIKFYDLLNNDNKFHPSIIKKIKKLLINGDYILGNETLQFEKSFANFVGSKYAIGCANGTDALILALKTLNLPKNSEVLVPAMTYCSTVFAVIHANLRPVLIDTKFNTPTIDLELIKKNISKKTRVILPVHLYGSAININLIRKITKKVKHKIYIVDDCAQAHGATDDDKKKIGSTADISCFSLYPGKNLGAYGDAGIITTNNTSFFKRLKNLRNLGSDKKFSHSQVGYNSRLDTIQSIILNLKLKNLNKNNISRRNIAKEYDKKINNSKLIKLNYSRFSVYHQYVILCKKRSQLVKFLDKNKIQYGFHYPKAIHQLECFRKIYKNKRYKNAEILASNGISLPIDPKLTKKETDFIINKLNEF